MLLDDLILPFPPFPLLDDDELRHATSWNTEKRIVISGVSKAIEIQSEAQSQSIQRVNSEFSNSY